MRACCGLHMLSVWAEAATSEAVPETHVGMCTTIDTNATAMAKDTRTNRMTATTLQLSDPCLGFHRCCAQSQQRCNQHFDDLATLKPYDKKAQRLHTAWHSRPCAWREYYGGIFWRISTSESDCMSDHAICVHTFTHAWSSIHYDTCWQTM